ncbi:MAG: prepilin-type N-terminal cleavage/methylation domain-containing protein [Patescibacteria group bacterium]
MLFFSTQTTKELPTTTSAACLCVSVRRQSCLRRGRGRQAQAGITLIESIVSIALLSIAVAGPMTLAAHSIKAVGAARTEMIATHLAEEGLEVVHSLRDNNSADDSTSDGRNWMRDIRNTCDAVNNGCVIDLTKHAVNDVWDTKEVLNKCGGSGCGDKTIVYFNTQTGLYRQSDDPLTSPWISTQFRRVISITDVDNPGNPQRQARVTSVVTYPDYGGKTQTMSISEDLYNWFPYLH